MPTTWFARTGSGSEVCRSSRASNGSKEGVEIEAQSEGALMRRCIAESSNQAWRRLRLAAQHLDPSFVPS